MERLRNLECSLEQIESSKIKSKSEIDRLRKEKEDLKRVNSSLLEFKIPQLESNLKELQEKFEI